MKLPATKRNYLLSVGMTEGIVEALESALSPDAAKALSEDLHLKGASPGAWQPVHAMLSVGQTSRSVKEMILANADGPRSLPTSWAEWDEQAQAYEVMDLIRAAGDMATEILNRPGPPDVVALQKVFQEMNTRIGTLTTEQKSHAEALARLSGEQP